MDLTTLLDERGLRLSSFRATRGDAPVYTALFTTSMHRVRATFLVRWYKQATAEDRDVIMQALFEQAYMIESCGDEATFRRLHPGLRVDSYRMYRNNTNRLARLFGPDYQRIVSPALTPETDDYR